MDLKHFMMKSAIPKRSLHKNCLTERSQAEETEGFTKQSTKRTG